MTREESSQIRSLLKVADYAALKGLLAEADLKKLSALWPRLGPMEKLVLFKLVEAPRVMDLYRRLEFKEKYHMLCGFPLSAIAPILEDLEPARRRLFVELPREFYDRMFRQLASERVEMSVSLRNN